MYMINRKQLYLQYNELVDENYIVEQFICLWATLHRDDCSFT